jgi:VIT1/CCC1 family predicted Fe2+/Mn2+ transporter
MAAGEFLSEETTHDLEQQGQKAHNPIIGGFIMLVSYGLAGMVPLIPIILRIWHSMALVASMAAALRALFLLGLVKGKVTGKSPLRSGIEVLVVGGIAAR